ncbi:hypothetical protein ACFX10_010536 [Malus domestica]
MDVEAKAAAPPSMVADLLRRNGGNVSDIEFSVLEKILPQCTVGELRQVEKSSGGRDLSPVTDKLWRKFYEQKFGPLMTDASSKRMKENERYRWMELFDSKEKEELDEAEKKAAERLKRRYKEEALRKQSRRVVVCKETEVTSSSRNKRKRSEDEVPSSSSNKGSNSGSSCGGDDGPVRKRKESLIMKKARKDFVNCIEVKNITAMAMVKLQKGYSSKKDLTLKRCAVLAEEY